MKYRISSILYHIEIIENYIKIEKIILILISPIHFYKPFLVYIIILYSFLSFQTFYSILFFFFVINIILNLDSLIF